MKSPSVQIASFAIGNICLTCGIALLGFVLALALLHGFVVFCHERRLFYEWNFIHYMSELENTWLPCSVLQYF